MACTGTDITDRGTMYIGVIYFGVCTGTDITGRDIPCIYRCCIFLWYVQGQTLQIEMKYKSVTVHNIGFVHGQTLQVDANNITVVYLWYVQGQTLQVDIYHVHMCCIFCGMYQGQALYSGFICA